MCIYRGGWSRIIKRQQVSDVTKVLIVQLKMVYMHSDIDIDIDTYDCGQVNKSCGQDMDLRDCLQARW